MRLLYLLFTLVNSDKFIKNININPCKNCIYFKQDSKLDLSKCEKFGKKDIINNKITYDYADMCRKYESKCGIEGKYFEEDTDLNLKLKKLKLGILDNSINIIVFFIPFLYIISYLIYIFPDINH